MSTIIILAKLLLAAVLGGLLGWERKNVADNPIGTKTYALVALGSTLFTLMSAYGFSGVNMDPTRIAAQIVVGIGFLGAGAIITHGGQIKGLTTAAGLWVSAGLGMAIGVGWHLVAVITAIAIFVALFLANRLYSPKK